MWKNHFQEIILERGENYYKSDRVIEFNHDGDHIDAKVLGYEPYNVRINFKNNEIDSMYCDCRYSANCKHQAAVLYYLEDHPQIIREDYGSLISAFTHGELVEFLSCELPKNPELANRMRLLKNFDVDPEYYVDKLYKSFESPVQVINFMDKDIMKLKDIELTLKLTGMIINYLDDLNDRGMYDAYDDVFEKIENLINHVLDLGYTDKVCDLLAHYIVSSDDDGLCDVFAGIYSRFRDVDGLFCD